MSNDIQKLILLAENILTHVNSIFPPAKKEPDWTAKAWRWIKTGHAGYLQTVSSPHQISLDAIRFVDHQKSEVVRNTQQFLQNLPANHVLLTGARGTGKSSLIKALLHTYADEGLRLIEVDKQDLIDLPEITQMVSARPEKFILFCDDLTFEAHDASYKALKVVLDGSIAHTADNLLVYATSNRKNLMPEWMQDNLPITDNSGEIRPNDTIEEKTALAERFGLWLSFYSFDQEEYLSIASYWLETMGLAFDDEARAAALRFYHTRGARSGRVAYQFAKDFAGYKRLQHD